MNGREYTVETAPTLRQVSLDGRLLWHGVKRASAYSDDPILCVCQGTSLTLVLSREARLIVSWRFCLPSAVRGAFVFGIPPMIASHLCATPPAGGDMVDLALDGNEVSFAAQDAMGRYELRWRFDLQSFPALPEMSRMLIPPSSLVRLKYLDMADSIHGAVAKLATIEAQQKVHRSKLAMLLGLSNGHLKADGREMRGEPAGQYYFDPRLVIRALDAVRAEQVEVGLTKLGGRQAFLSIVDRQPAFVQHCALLSVGPGTQRIFSSSAGLSR